MLWKRCYSICQQIWETQQWPQDWKRSVFIPVPKKGSAKECSNYCTIAFIPHASKVMLKVLQATLQQHVNCELPDVQTGFRKGRGTRDQIANICWIIEKARVPEKHLLLLYWPHQNILTVWITTNCGEFFKSWEYQTTLPASWEIYMQVRKQQLKPDMDNGLVPNWKRSTFLFIKAVYRHLVHLTYMQSISCEMPGWKKHKLKSRLLGEISITSDMQKTPSLWQKEKRK